MPETLIVGMSVRHAELAWEGQIQADRNKRWFHRCGDGTVFLRVAWYSGLTEGGHRPRPGWVDRGVLRHA